MSSQLESGLVDERREEMDRSGRSHIYPKIQNLLEDERRRVLDLVNHGMAMVDDILDSTDNPSAYLEHLRKIFQKSYSSAIIEASTSDKQAVVDLGQALNKMTSARFSHFTDRAIGKHIYFEVLNYWEAEEKISEERDKF